VTVELVSVGCVVETAELWIFGCVVAIVALELFGCVVDGTETCVVEVGCVAHVLGH